MSLARLLEQATPPRPIPEWWSEKAVDEVKRAHRRIGALAPDMAQLLIDMADWVEGAGRYLAHGSEAPAAVAEAEALLARFAALDGGMKWPS